MSKEPVTAPVIAPVIAIDGPSGVGKSTLSRLVAKRLGFIYIDTGAMYRAVAVSAADAGINMDDEGELADFLKKIQLEFGKGNDKIFLNKEDVTDKIRTPEASRLASVVSSKKVVREFLVAMQQELGREGGVVMEGRDIGTAVFPNADLKIFLDASVDARGDRRFKELESKPGQANEKQEVTEAIKERDRRDTERSHSPLKKADDAVYVDTTLFDLEEVGEKIFTIIRERLGIGDTHS